MVVVSEQGSNLLGHWALLAPRFPRVAMMARDILSVQAAGVGIEREFSIAASFNTDNRTFSAPTLAALMICNHFQSEENRISQRRYFLELRQETITPEELEAEEADDREAAGKVISDLAENYISDHDERDSDELQIIRDRRMGKKNSQTKKGSSSQASGNCEQGGQGEDQDNESGSSSETDDEEPEVQVPKQRIRTASRTVV